MKIVVSVQARSLQPQGTLGLFGASGRPTCPQFIEPRSDHEVQGLITETEPRTLGLLLVTQWNRRFIPRLPLLHRYRQSEHTKFRHTSLRASTVNAFCKEKDQHRSVASREVDLMVENELHSHMLWYYMPKERRLL